MRTQTTDLRSRSGNAAGYVYFTLIELFIGKFYQRVFSFCRSRTEHGLAFLRQIPVILHSEERSPAKSDHTSWCGTVSARTKSFLNIHAAKPIKSQTASPFSATSTVWQSAAEMIFMGDNLNAKYKTSPTEDNFTGHYILEDTGSGSGGAAYPHFRHSGKCNILYGDGHVKGILPLELGDSLRTPGNWNYFTSSNIAAGRYP